MMECKPVTTPMDSGTKLVKTSGVKEEDQQLPYRELVGALTYLSTMTRPDIAFAVRNLSQFNNCYSTEHWKGAKRVLRYLKGTSNLGLVYKSKSGNLEGFVDADWGNNIEDRKSYSGYLFSLGGSAISWYSRK
ncbi:hypothetical protein R5R35_014688 [Gryllus longicercus]|uniref:Uncharacterized protein n=1 Tax=Gryllus longicercus TaxID=2509291 RepID=A0AAN9YW25_9ORTH